MSFDDRKKMQTSGAGWRWTRMDVKVYDQPVDAVERRKGQEPSREEAAVEEAAARVPT